jgi:hypothetical protein
VKKLVVAAKNTDCYVSDSPTIVYRAAGQSIDKATVQDLIGKIFLTSGASVPEFLFVVMPTQVGITYGKCKCKFEIKWL